MKKATSSIIRYEARVTINRSIEEVFPRWRSPRRDRRIATGEQTEPPLTSSTAPQSWYERAAGA